MSTPVQFPSHKPTKKAGILLYDARCELCRRAVAWLTARDRDSILDCQPLQNDAALAGYGISPEVALSALHAIEFHPVGERIYVGADAVFWAVSRISPWARPFLGIAPIRRLARVVYREIARRRKRDDDCACSVEW